MTSAPAPIVTSTASAEPTTAWLRRRRRPLRRMIGGRGSFTVSATCPSDSSRARIDVESASSATATAAVAVWRWSSARCWVSPISRPISISGTAARWVSTRALRWASGSLCKRVEESGLVGGDVLLAAPAPGAVPPLRGRPGPRAHPLLGVGHPADLVPVVPGGDVGVAHGRPGGAQVAGEGEGLEDEPSAGADVELVEFLGCGHDGSRLREAWEVPPTRVARPDGVGLWARMVPS